MLVAVAGWAQIRLNDKDSLCNYMALPMVLVAVLVASITREVLRFAILNDAFGYNFFDYKVTMDWYSTGLFFGTFAIVGGAVLAYFLTIAWRVGQSTGVYTASAAVDRMGTLAIWITFLWLIHFFVLGFVVWAQ
jgi:hypothetical protein